MKKKTKVFNCTFFGLSHSLVIETKCGESVLVRSQSLISASRLAAQSSCAENGRGGPNSDF